MNDSSLDSNPLGELAEEFLERRSRGEHPTIAEYAARYPSLADQILAFFPALIAVEELKPRPDECTNLFNETARHGRELKPDQLGDFRIIRELGRGGMGVVYEAEQESLSRRVALKVLGSPMLLDARRLARFHREAKAAARLHHTNIVPVFGVGEVDGVHYYAMQFIQGAGLDEVLEDVRRLQAVRSGASGSPMATPCIGSGSSGNSQPGDLNQAGAVGGGNAARETGLTGSVRQSGDSASVIGALSSLSATSGTGPSYARSVARIGAHVAEALAYAHEQGILHRDIKPSNILLDIQGTPWVTDFGLAKATADEDLTHTGDIVGTIRYMAPERFHGRCNALSDVYALGLTLYELLARAPAFEGSDRNQLIRQVHQIDPLQLRKRDSTIPRDLETIVHKAIEKDSADRYSSAAALAGDLRRFLEDQPILARRASLADRTRRWSRRNRLTAVFAVTAAVSLILAACVGWAGYVITTKALRQEQQRLNEAVTATRLERAATERAEENVSLSLEVFQELFDKLAANDIDLLPPPPGLPHGFARLRPESPQGERVGRPSPEHFGQHRPPIRNGFHRRPAPLGQSEEESQLLESMLRFYERFAKRNATNQRLQGEVAWAYRKVGALHSRLGHSTEAEAAYQRSMDLFEDLIVGFPNTAIFRAKLVETCIMADPWSTPADSLEALESRLRRAQFLIAALGDGDPSNLDYLQDRVHVEAKLGTVLHRIGRDSEAIESYERAIAIGCQLIKSNPRPERARLDRALIRESLARVLQQRGQQERAGQLLDSAVIDLRAIAPMGPMFAVPLETLDSIAQSYRLVGRSEEAEAVVRWAGEVQSRMRESPWAGSRIPMRRPSFLNDSPWIERSSREENIKMH